MQQARANLPGFTKRFSRWQRRFVGVGVGIGAAVMVSLLLSLQTGAIAQVNQATVTEILDGQEVYIQNNQARVNDRADRGQRVSTGNARTQLEFNTGAIARLSSNSVLTVGQCAQLQSGTLLVNGAVNGCTPSTLAGVRGTTYLLQVDEESGEERITVLEGEVEITRQVSEPSETPETESPAMPEDMTPEPSEADAADLQPQELTGEDLPGEEITETPAPESELPVDGDADASGDMVDASVDQPDPSAENAADTVELSEEPITLRAGQRLTTSRGDRQARVGSITAEEFLEILAGVLFQGFTSELPGMSNLQSSFNRLYPGVDFPLPFSTPRPNIPRLPF